MHTGPFPSQPTHSNNMFVYFNIEDDRLVRTELYVAEFQNTRVTN